MQDSRYCYPDSDVLINIPGIKDKDKLSALETKLTWTRLSELQEKPIKGKFDFNHLKKIHQYIFQDLYEWAGEERTVEIGKGNLFCTVVCIQDYARSVFGKYYSQCYANKDNFDDFVRVLADNYGDLNALHPFREGNGRAQREFARLVCLSCGYDFRLSCTTHSKMLEASILSFNKGDNSGFVRIFSKAVSLHRDEVANDKDVLDILTSDDLTIGATEGYDYYGYDEYENAETYNAMYRARVEKMDAEKTISDAQASLNNNHKNAKRHSTKGYSVIEKLQEKKQEAKEIEASKQKAERKKGKSNQIEL